MTEVDECMFVGCGCYGQWEIVISDLRGDGGLLLRQEVVIGCSLAVDGVEYW
jgi:hypothetical protein